MEQADLVWASAYGSTFALMVQQRMNEGREAPDDKAMDGYAEEARYIADEAVKRMKP